MLEAKSILIGTPVMNNEKSRSYLNVYGLHQMSNFKDVEEDPQNDQQLQQTQNEIIFYGTNIHIYRVSKLLQKFIKQFQYKKEDSQSPQKIYLKQLSDLDLDALVKNQYIVDARHLYEFDKQLYYQLIYYPAEIITLFDKVLKEIYQKQYIQDQTHEITRNMRERKKDCMQTVINHLHDRDILCLKDFNAKSIGRLISMKGIVVKASEIYPQMKKAHFRCSNCQFQMSVELSNAKVSEPKECTQCKAKDSFNLQHNLCQFTDKQYLKVQQLPEDIAEGGITNTINLIAYDEHTDSVRPGDMILIVGIYRAISRRVQSKFLNLNRIFNTYIDVISLTHLEEKECRLPSQHITFSQQEIKKFYKMAESQTIINDLVQSFCPSIFGHQDIKKGILAQLFGGTKKHTQRGHFRSDINICLLGDPSTAKSQFLQQIHKITSRGVYTNGRGTSAVGLTANVRKDPETHEFILESGALILSDEGICCIDQFDKMNENSKIVLLQVMEQQTISIAKSGIVCQLNSRTSILAAANPLNSKYDKNKSIIQNINLPPTLLSRFDLIFIILDVPNRILDEKIANHILDMYCNKSMQSKIGKYDYNLLKRYITFAKQHIHPTLSQEVCGKLATEYIQLRKKGQSKNIISATPRLLESFIRISQAFAKMRLSNSVTESDVELAINLVKKATLNSATDPNTGIVDLGMLSTGISSAKAKKLQQLSFVIKEMILANEAKYRNSTSIQKLAQDLKKLNKINFQQIGSKDLIQAINILQTEDLLAVFGQDREKPCFKLQRINGQ